MHDCRAVSPRLFAAAAGLLALALLVPGASAADAELDWVARLPGVAHQKDKPVAGGIEHVFTATDGPRAFDGVREGLRERGFAIDKATDVGLGVGAVRTLRASRGQQRAKVTLNTSGGSTLLVVTLTGTAEPPTAAAGGRRGSSAGAAGAAQELIGSLLGGVPAAGGAAGLEIFDNGVEQTHDCGGRAVAVHANRTRLTFEGDCPEVAANGNDNRIVINGRVGRISAAGNGNTISWSPAANPLEPRVADLGRGNSITRADGAARP